MSCDHCADLQSRLDETRRRLDHALGQLDRCDRAQPALRLVSFGGPAQRPVTPKGVPCPKCGMRTLHWSGCDWTPDGDEVA